VGVPNGPIGSSVKLLALLVVVLLGLQCICRDINRVVQVVGVFKSGGNLLLVLGGGAVGPVPHVVRCGGCLVGAFSNSFSTEEHLDCI
jgi:hypothetical protein